MNNFIGPPVNFLTNGLCGGMSYAVLDYFYAGIQVPEQEYRPANGTTIQTYLYGRQVTTLVPNVDKWAELVFNPFGQRTLEFFNWGLNERLIELKSFVDRGVPVPLGLHNLGAFIAGDHQVLAIGYDMGRYKGDLGAYKDDLKIFVLDPNFPKKTMTLVPGVATNDYYYLEDTTKRWRTYFVDGKYARQTPPTVRRPDYPADGLVHELLFAMTTGFDDMRGGADHVDVTLRMSDNTTRYFSNISEGGRWIPQYTETARLVFSEPFPLTMLRSIEISTNSTGGLNGDNWDLDAVRVEAVGGFATRQLLTQPGGPFRFTGARIPLIVEVR